MMGKLRTIQVTKLQRMNTVDLVSLPKPIIVTAHGVPLVIIIEVPRDDEEIDEISPAVRKMLKGEDDN